MKRKYEKPMAFVEAFVADEYVAACYSLSCKVGSHKVNPVTNTVWPSNEYYRSGWGWAFEEEHASSGTGNCSDAASNYLTVSDAGTFISLEEWRSDLNNGKGKFLHGTRTGYKDLNKNGKCDAGDYIAWNTTNGDRTWHHWGIAQTADAAHPNHS